MPAAALARSSTATSDPPAPASSGAAAETEAPGRIDAGALWRQLVAGAASPWERAAWASMAGDADGDAGDPLPAAWANAATGGDPATLERLFAWRGIPEVTIRRALREVDLPEDVDPPAWAAELREIAGALADDLPLPERLSVRDVAGDAGARAAGVDGAAEWSLNRVFAPMLALGAVRLDASIERACVETAPAVRRAWLAQLAGRMGQACAQLFFHRVNVADLLADHPGALGESVLATFFPPDRAAGDGWAALLGAYPVLGRVLADVLAGWHAAADELLRRLGDNRAALQAAFSADAPLGPLVEIDADAGDVHDFGRTVVILRFGGGVRVVYKPRDLRVAGAYMALVRAVNDAGLHPPLATRTVLVMDGYAWEEHVRAAPCADERELHRFYLRMGMLARLFQLTGGADFTTDNVLACGEHPTPIDLETLVAPLPAPLEPASVDHAAEAVLAELPLRSGLLTAPVFGEPGLRPADVGALGAGDRRAPFRQAVLRRGDDGQVRLKSAYADFPGNSATPWLDGQPARPAEHFGAVEEGYRRMGAALRACAGALAAPGGPLDALAAAPVRFLARDTHVYARILQASLRPAELRSGVARELCLERLWRARFSHPGVVAAEISALRQMDVPIFAAVPSSPALALGPHGDAPGFFGAAPIDGVRARLASLENRGDAEEGDAVRTALFVVDPGWRAPVSPAVPAPLAPWLDAAVRVGDELLSVALPGTDGSPAWVGLEYLPAHDRWRVAPLGDDVLTGRAGIAVVLAELARHTGAARFATAARGILNDVAVALPVAVSNMGANPLFCGALHGWGSALLACVRGGQALGTREPIARAASAFTALSTGDVRTRAPDDLACGRLGLAWAIAAAARELDDAGLASLASRLAEEVDDPGVEPRPSPYPPNAWLVDIAPTGILSEALVRHRLAAMGIASAPAPDASGDATSGVGDLLARLELKSPDAVADAFAFATAARDAGPVALLDAAEVALVCARHGGGDAAIELAGEHARRLIAVREAHGRWFADRMAPDRYMLSAVTGVAAVAHLFLALHDPSAFRSLRLAETRAPGES